MTQTVVRTAALFALVGLLSLVSPVEASPVVVAPGTANQSVLIGTSQNMGTTNPGTLLATMSQALNIGSGHIVGTVISAVYQNAGGFLDFYYQVINTTPGPANNNSISGLAGYNFGGFTTSVGYYSSASVFGGVFQSPLHFFGPGWEGRPRSADRSANGNVVNLWFGPTWGATKIDPGEVSNILMISTNATNFGLGWATLQNGGPASTGTVQSFQVQVPEPASVAVVMFGLAVLASRRRRLL